MTSLSTTNPIAPPDSEISHRAAFLEAMRCVPGAVAIVASAQGDERGGLVVTGWSSLCADPPMVLVCINKSASAHDFIVGAGAFGLSMLSTNLSEIVGHFSGKDALKGKDRFTAGYWTDTDAGQPLVRNAAIAFECTIEDCHSHGTHTILIGKVGEIRRSEKSDALLYLNGQFASATTLEY